MQLLRDLGALGRGACGSERGSDDIGVQVERALRAEGDFLGGGGAWLALHDLMSRQYWEGLWVIQEIVMGASATWLRCGNEWLDWGAFCDGVAFL